MADGIGIAFQPLSSRGPGDLVVFVGDDLALSPAAAEALGRAGTDLVARAAASERFKGKAQSAMSLPAPAGVEADRLTVIGLGAEKDKAKLDWTLLGGFTAGRVGGRSARVLLDWPGIEAAPGNVADFTLGARLRSYSFDRYKTKKKDGDDDTRTQLTVLTADPAAAEKAAGAARAVAEGVSLARNLINEPPNVLFPEEYARRAAELTQLGVEVEVLDLARLRELGMGALLAVAQGSAREPRVVVMRWNGAADRSEPPLALVGKGVVFDSGGVSIKSAGGMEDMKGDMGGSAAVVGTLHALAARGAKANVIGAIGLVENMPDGNAYRPSDIVTAMSGQTIEIINTDAEGRLVLADVLHHVIQSHKPKAVIDLATLTGAIIVALGQEIAGLFSNDDALSAQITAAGEAAGEKVWRMPLIPAFDKAIDSKFADMKNTGGRHGGAATAAAFLKRFVGDTPWAHLDIAGVAMNSSANEINRSWGAGWGVRLLDRLVRDAYEA